MADCAGELGPLDPILAILASVLPLSRPLGFQVLKTDGPNGEALPGAWEKGLRWGMEPARSLDKRVEDWEELVFSERPGGGVLLNGVWAGVGREDWLESVGMFRRPFPRPPAGNRGGTVPARARRVDGAPSVVGSCAKSGNPSVGDSGMFSRNGVEFPLVGGPPHGLVTGSPSCAWISRALFVQVSICTVEEIGT